MRAINVYAWHEDLPSIAGFERVPVCSDGSWAVARPTGLGQVARLAGAAWHLAFSFASLADLARKLNELDLPDYIQGEPRRMRRGELQTLAIDCHGTVGTWYPNGVRTDLAVTADNLMRFREALRGIGIMTAAQRHMASVLTRPFSQEPSEHPASSIILIACNTGATASGSRLLTRLSLEWPGRRVVGFSSSVLFPTLRNATTDLQSGERCQAPAVSDTGVRHLSRDFREAVGVTWWPRPETMVLADATTDNAKVARDGRIIDTPLNETRGGQAEAARRAGIVGPPRARGR